MKSIRLRLVYCTPLFVLALAGASEPAHAGVRLTVVGLGDMNNPTLEPDTTSLVTKTSGTSFGGGGWLDFGLGSHRAALEIGALYVPHKFRLGATNFPSFYTDLSSTWLQFPVVLRLHLFKGLSIGLGGYYGMALGKLKSTDSDGTVTESDYAEAGYKKTEMGLIGSVGLKFPLGSSLALVLDGRYLMGMTNGVEDSTKAGGTTSAKNVDLQGLIGFQFGQSGMMK